MTNKELHTFVGKEVEVFLNMANQEEAFWGLLMIFQPSMVIEKQIISMLKICLSR